MAARSKVYDLAPELRAELDRLLREQRCTLDQVVAHLRQLAPDGEDLPSRSSIGRYAANLEAISSRLKRSREIADRLIAEAGPQVADGKGFQVLVQGFQSLAFDMLANLPEDETLDPENLSFLARAIASIATAQKTDTDRAFRIRQEANKEAAAKVEDVGKAKGLSADTIKAITHAVLGVA